MRMEKVMMRMMKMVLSVFTLMMIAGCWSVPHDWFGEIHHIPPPEPFIYMEYHYPADGEREVWYADSGVFQTYRLKDGVIKDCRAGSSGEGFYGGRVLRGCQRNGVICANDEYNSHGVES